MGYDGYEIGDDEYYLDDLEDEALDEWRYRINETDDESEEDVEEDEDDESEQEETEEED